MTIQICRAAVIGVAAATLIIAPALADQGAEPRLEKAFEEIAKELKDIGRMTYELETHVPNAFDSAEEERRTRVMAQRAELGEIDLKHVAGAERVPIEDGGPSTVELRRIEVSGRAPFENLHRFLVSRGSLNRFVMLETLRLTSEAGKEGNTISFAARFAFPVTSVPAEGAKNSKSPEDMLRQEVLRRKANLQVLTEIAVRSNPTRLVDALAIFGGGMGERTVSLAEVRFDGPSDGKAVLQGTISSASRNRLEPALEKAGLHVSGVQTSPSGACQTFVATAKLDEFPTDGEIVIDNGLFKTGSVCDTPPRR
jgi:hypothetical protein